MKGGTKMTEAQKRAKKKYYEKTYRHIAKAKNDKQKLEKALEFITYYNTTYNAGIQITQN